MILFSFFLFFTPFFFSFSFLFRISSPFVSLSISSIRNLTGVIYLPRRDWVLFARLFSSFLECNFFGRVSGWWWYGTLSFRNVFWIRLYWFVIWFFTPSIKLCSRHCPYFKLVLLFTNLFGFGKLTDILIKIKKSSWYINNEQISLVIFINWIRKLGNVEG